MDARAKALLAKDAKPKVEAVRAQTHVHREFKLPSALRPGAPAEASGPEDVAAVANEPTPAPPPFAAAAPATETATEMPTEEAPAKAQASAPPPAKDTPLIIEAKTEARSSTKFRAGTLAWFDSGKEVDDSDGAYEVEPTAAQRAAALVRQYPAVILGVAGAILALVLVLALR